MTLPIGGGMRKTLKKRGKNAERIPLKNGKGSPMKVVDEAEE